ncbi:MAG: RnfABCDGE type electron transport complex subunit D [Flavobacteriales bacterium]
MSSRITSHLRWLASDGRHVQLISQLSFLAFGIGFLGWDTDWKNYLMAATGCLLIQFIGIRFAGQSSDSWKSALITTMGLCLLMRANHPILFAIAGVLAISQKFALKVNGKHLWNPANIGIVAVILMSGEAWISPGQWGTGALLIFIIGTAGLTVLGRIKRMETGIAFIVTFALLEIARTKFYLNWEWDVVAQKLSNGSLWLFAFFMITDPMTTPNHRFARVLWSMCVAGTAFYLGNFKFLPGAPFWSLVLFTPMVPLIDYLVKGQRFQWTHRASHSEQTKTQTI